ncbi:MAG: FMN-dependent NADH-azoreductase, partial [Curvibacter sp.]
MKLLHIDSSVLGDNSVSRQLTAQTVAQWKARHPDAEVSYLDVAAQAP